MNLTTWLTGMIDVMDSALPVEWLRATIVLSLFSTWVVVGAFWYLNRLTPKSYFSLWNMAWLFYSLWLLAGLHGEVETGPWKIMLERACMGISALFMYWGSFELTGSTKRSRRELLWGVGLIILWSYAAAFHVREERWITVPVFCLLATASLYTGNLYRRLMSRYRGASMLAAGFSFLAIHLVCRAFIEPTQTSLLTISYVSSSVLSIFIALGMVVQTLEQGQAQNETLVAEFKRGMAARRLLEEEVSVSEQKYQALFQAASDAFFLVDLETLEITEYNRAAEAFVGSKPSNGVRRSFLELCPPLRGSKPGALLHNKRLVDEVIGTTKEFNMLLATGMPVLCEGSVALVQYNHRSALQINVREVTERKRLEQQLRQSEKLSALGQLTAGVAHELNNPLAIIMGYAQVLLKQPGRDEKLRGDIGKIYRESERAAKIVRNLLTFARPREPQMLSVDLNRLVANILETYEAEFESASIRVQANLAPDLPRTVADPHQIEQVLANLVMNALQAMQEVPTRHLTLSTGVVDRAIRIGVHDSGPGVATEVVSRIFDPFFTTKAPGKGTGLGLSISHSIVHEHGGRIWVQSQPGAGATFFVELPLVQRTMEEELEAASGPAEPSPSPTVTAAGSYRLLVVDDEPGILEVMETVLTGNGYAVDTAANGNEALGHIERHRYDLIISDLCMPGVDGEGLYRRVRETNQVLASRMIFVTGDTVSTKSRTFLEWTGNRWFSKPFQIGQLEEVVANFLKETESAPVS